MSQLDVKNVSGRLPSYDGEQFQLNIRGQRITNAEDAKHIVTQILTSLRSPLAIDKELRFQVSSTAAKANSDYIERQIRAGHDSTIKKLSGQTNKVNKSSEDLLQEEANYTRKQAGLTVTMYTYKQFLNDVPLDDVTLQLTHRTETSMASVHGRFFDVVKPTNKKVLDANAALAIAVASTKAANKYNEIKAETTAATLVLLPYADGFKFAWKSRILADGPYAIWVDAETGKVLQLLPRFVYSDNARGLVFSPSPTGGTLEMSFEVDAPVNGTYTLKKTGVLVLTNAGGDGVGGIVQVTDDGSGTANFNIAPFNGTVVDRTNQSGYNGQFQQINIFAHIFNQRRIYLALGSNPFSEIDVTFNSSGDNSYCCPPHYFTGEATISATDPACPASCNGDPFYGIHTYNGGIDGTVIAHEFGHQLNELQFKGGAGGFVMPSQLHEGMADYWACTNFNTNIFAGWWAHECTAPTQAGYAPRQADAGDVFPGRISNSCASYEGHSAGQIICWANWSAREGMNDATGWGTLTNNLNLIKALFTASYSTYDETARSTHDSYQDLLEQAAPLYSTSRLIHKLLAGYARAGIFLSPQDAIIDIDHSYLNSNSATGPVFSIWTGEDYTFSGTSVVTTGTLPFNTQFMVEVANDEAFTTNLVSSGWQGGVAAGDGGHATWTLPASDWNTLRSGEAIYYRVTSKGANGGNIRQSWNPGNGFVGTVPVGKAAINGTGTKDCACSAASAPASSPMGLIPVLPLVLLIAYRKKNNHAS